MSKNASLSAKSTRRKKTGSGKVSARKAIGPSGDGEGSLRKIQRPFLIVGVGASAGGMEAFIQMLRNVPPDIQAAFVFICHLSPDHESSLGEIFQRETQLPVSTVNEQVAVAPGHVYVLPPNRHLRIMGDVLRPEPRKRDDGQYRPIDVFFQSLAIDQGNCAVGILMSGNGSDGAVGLEQIKAEGGITFAQTEGTANFPALPAAALATGCVDFVLAPNLIGAELKRISRNPALLRVLSPRGDEPLTESNTELQRIFSLLRALNGVDFSHYKHSTLKRRILRRMFLRKVERLSEYIAFLQKNPSEVDLLFHDLLINVTAFFRDPEMFQALRKKIFPKIIKKGRREPIRVWIPGCSTGEEVYSIAISLFEFLGKNTNGRSVQVFATDISETALAKARVGMYPESIATDVSPERLRRFFVKVDGGYQIAKFIRDGCVFARQNLIEDPPFSKLDFISCRNVLIYLGPLLQKKVIPIFHYALKPEGHLILGGSETIGMFAELFDLVDKKNKIYAKRAGATMPGVRFTPRSSLPDSREPLPQMTSHEEAAPTLDLTRQIDRLLLAQYAPNGVVVNARMEVVQFRGQTGTYLEHPAGDASLSLLRMLRPELLVDVRSALTRAIKLDSIIRKEHVQFLQGGKPRQLNLEIIPFKNAPSEERYFLIIFAEDPTEDSRVSSGAGKPPAHRDPAKREIVRLREELGSTKESLQAIIEEQEATNEELKSANEEIQSSNEELQSTNEELETAKEELQSTNEELTTLNEELQNRNVELSQLNNDLRNLLSSVSMPILMLGNDLTIRRFTPLAERYFNLIPTDIGRRISDINPNVQVENLAGRVTEVIESLKTQEHEVQDRDGRWHSLRIRPYRTTDNKIDGAVIMLVDIDEIKRCLDEFVSLVSQPVLSLRGDFHVNRANDAFYKLFGLTRKQTEDKLIYDLDDGHWNSTALKNLLEGSLPEKQSVENFRIEHDFGEAGRKSLAVSARRMYQISKGTQLILLAFEELDGAPK